MPDPSLPPNHHADHPGFSGLSGLLIGVALTFGRKPAADLAADLVSLGPEDRLVDIGCGPGVAVRHALRRGAASAIGVDPAAVMLRLARLLTFDRRASWEQGIAEALPLEAACATVVWSLATVHHWQDVEQGLAETRRVLRPGGRFLAIERQVAHGATGMASHGWIPEQAEAFAEQCREAGLTEVQFDAHDSGTVTLLVVRAALPGG